MEYHRSVEKSVDAPASLPTLLYRLHVCRIAKNECMEARGVDQTLYRRLGKDMTTLRDRCRPATSRSLGLAIGLTQQVEAFWSPVSREILEEYRRVHPTGVDVRVLLCVAYNTGPNYGPVVIDGRKVDYVIPDAPRPDKVLEVAQSILKDHPDDALGHFYVGRAQFQLDHLDSALKEIQTALGTGELPPVYASVSKAFLARPSRIAFRPKIVY